MSDRSAEHAPRQKWVLPVMAALFLGPLIAAWVVYFAGETWRPVGTVNHGVLLEPPVSLLALNDADDGQAQMLRGKWSLLILTRDCERPCLDALDSSRRVRLALRQKAPRVQRVLLYTGTLGEDVVALAAETGVRVLSGASDGGARVAAALPAAAGEEGSVIVTDPLGNAVMAFAPDFEMRGMLADLKRLLKLSRIG